MSDCESDNDSVSSKLVIDIECNDPRKEATNNKHSINPLIWKRTYILKSASEENNEDGKDLYSDMVTRVGHEFQAMIPQYRNKLNTNEINNYNDGLSVLLWKPNKCKENDIKLYLKRYANKCGYQLYRTCDDEDALFLLMKNKYNIEKSLVQMVATGNSGHVSKEPKKMTLLECREFEKNFLKHRKQFRLYLECNDTLRNRQLWELVFFYYIWKKSSRFAVMQIKHKEISKNMIDFMKYQMIKHRPLEMIIPG